MYDQPPVLTGGPAVAALDRVVHRALAKRAERAVSVGRRDGAGSARRARARRHRQRRARRAPVTRLIVLPFRMLRPDPETDFLAFSLADAVTSCALRPAVAGRPLEPGRVAVRVGRSGPEGDRDRGGSGRGAGRHAAARRRSAARRDAARRDARRDGPLVAHRAGAGGDLFRLQDDLTGKIVESLSLPLTARERRMLKQDVPSSPRCLRAATCARTR